ncbi:hypothetical protein Tco_1553372 [Tanacetum coccineum]
MNNPRLANRGVSVGPNVSFKSTKHIYRPISNKNGANTSGKKKQVEVARENVNSNPFDALNFVEDDLDLGTNGRNSKLLGNVDSESEVKVVFEETANLTASTSFKGGSDKGYVTNSLLQQWRETKRNDDYDTYDGDLYESHDMSDHLQPICDDIDIIVRGRKKK